MTALFLCGPLGHAPLLALILGRSAKTEPATLPDHAAHWSAATTFHLLPEPGATALGTLLHNATPDDLARLAFYTADTTAPRPGTVQTASGPVPAMINTPAPPPDVTPWHLSDWLANDAALTLATARDVMALYGQKPGPDVARRRSPMQVRAASRLRAATPTPTTLRRTAAPDDVQLRAQHQPYANFFAVEEYDLRYRRFDGGFSADINRAAFISGDAVTVLPYDPQRDRVLLIEQFRTGPLARGDAQPWLLEAIAGRIDPGESPEHAARREAVEEAGLTLGTLHPVANYYPSPGAKSEYIYSYLALCDLPDGCEGIFGEASEAEDIRGHLITFDHLMTLVETGEVDNAPLLLTALWLQRERPRLRPTP